MKTNTKIILLLIAVCIAIVLLFGGAIYYFLNEYSYIDFYKRLETRARIAAQQPLERSNTGSENVRSLKEQYLEKLELEKEYIIEINTESSTKNISEIYQLPKRFIETILKKGEAREKKGSVFYAGIITEKGSKKYLVIASAENYYVSHHLLFIRNIIIVGFLMVTLLVISFSIYFSKQIFAPIKEITDKVKQISTENMYMRVNTFHNNHEIGELVITFNDLLNRIETSFETQKNFISNASHELGTPLTAIIGEADVSLLKPRTAEEYQKSLQNILHQAERLDQITKSLLFLAQTGYTGKSIPIKILRMDEIIWETKSLIDKLNPDNKITVDLNLLPEDPKKLKINGNNQLLQLAFANILNNACKYSSNGPVTVSIASSDAQLIISIKDEGIGIPENELAFIYDPFFRASNTRLFEGYGIGLPLTRNIIRLHNGELNVNAVQNSGTLVQIKLPLI
jgi:signal transduction histidine kinase